MIASERYMYIINQLKENKVVDLKVLAKDLKISESTVRRDIDQLEKKGRLRRVLGGAELIDEEQSQIMTDLRIQQRYGLHMREKTRIAARAAEIVSMGDSVFIDGGTSMAPLFRLLCKKKIQIVTTNHIVLHEITQSEANIIIIGGNYLPHFYMTTGLLTEMYLKNFHFDHTFISCSGIDLNEGMSYVSEIETLAVKKIASEQSHHNNLLIDSSKLLHHAFCKLLPLDSFDHVFCDRSAEMADLKFPANFVIIDDIK